MPHKPAPKDGAIPAFVSVSLTNELKPHLAEYAARNEDDLKELIASIVLEGYSLTVKAESDTGFQANLRPLDFCKNPGNKGKMLVERGGTPIRALMRLFWCHNEHFEANWPKGERMQDDDW